MFLISSELFCKQWFRGPVSLYLVALLSWTHGFQSHPVYGFLASRVGRQRVLAEAGGWGRVCTSPRGHMSLPELSLSAWHCNLAVCPGGRDGFGKNPGGSCNNCHALSLGWPWSNEGWVDGSLFIMVIDSQAGPFWYLDDGMWAQMGNQACGFSSANEEEERVGEGDRVCISISTSLLDFQWAGGGEWRNKNYLNFLPFKTANCIP